MNTVRLYVDGRGVAWALVRCVACHDVRKYPAQDASDHAIRCACGAEMDVRERFNEEALCMPWGRELSGRGPAPDL